MTRLDDIIRLLTNPDRVRIFKDDEEIFVGYRYSLTTEEEFHYNDIKDCEVKKFKTVPEIRHKKWQEKGLMRPMMPDEMAEYNFSDLQMSLYYTIHI